MKLLLDARLPSLLTVASGKLTGCCLRGISEIADFRVASLRLSFCTSSGELSGEAVCNDGSVDSSGISMDGDEVVRVGNSAIDTSLRFSFSI